MMYDLLTLLNLALLFTQLIFGIFLTIVLMFNIGCNANANILSSYSTISLTFPLWLCLSDGKCHVWRNKKTSIVYKLFRGVPFPLLLSSLLLRRISMTSHMTLSSALFEHTWNCSPGGHKVFWSLPYRFIL